MVFSRLPLFWAAFLCCAANGDLLETTSTGSSRVDLPTSSSASSLQRQAVSTSSPTLPSSKIPDLPRSSSASTVSIAISQPTYSTTSDLFLSSPLTNSSSSNTHISGPLPPPPTSRYNASTVKKSASDRSSQSYTSSPNAIVVQISSEDDDSTASLSSVTSNGGVWGATVTTVEYSNVPAPSTSATAQVSPSHALPPSDLSFSSNFTASYVANGTTTTTKVLSPPADNSSRPSPSSEQHSTTSKFSTPPTRQFWNTTTTTRHGQTPPPRHHNHSSSCTPYSAGETITIYSVVPNTNTITITLINNQTNTFTPIPEPSYPTTCHASTTSVSSPTIGFGGISGLSTIVPSISSTLTFGVFSTETPPSVIGFYTPPSTVVIVTSKNPVTDFTIESRPDFPGTPDPDKQSVLTTTPKTDFWSPLPPTAVTGSSTPTPTPSKGGSGGDLNAPGSGSGNDGAISFLPLPPSTVNVGGVTVVVGPSSVAVGKQTLALGEGSSKIIMEGSQTFTVNPSQVIGPGTTVAIPKDTGGIFVEGPIPTMVDGVPVSVGNDIAAVGGSTFAIGAGAPDITIIINRQSISIGAGGVGFADMTITPAATIPTNVVIIGGELFSVIGASVAAFDGDTFTYTGGVPQTTIFNGDTITFGPSGLVDGTQTLGGPNHPTATQYGIAGGIYISEIGSTIAVIDGTTLTVGPNAMPTTATIDGHTITAGPDGVDVDGGTTISFPLNPTTQVITADGLTFSEIGNSLVNIGGTTFTVGPGATPTTDIYNSQTISIGPGGVGFATTMVSSNIGSPPAATTTKKKKNSAASMKPFLGGVWGGCIALGVRLLI